MKGLLPAPAWVLSGPDARPACLLQPETCVCSLFPNTEAGPGWGHLMKCQCAFMKSGMGPTEMLKSGQLRDRRESSLAVGLQRSRTWHRAGPAASATNSQAPRGTGGEGGWLLAGQLMGEFTRLSLNFLHASPSSPS